MVFSRKIKTNVVLAWAGTTFLLTFFILLPLLFVFFTPQKDDFIKVFSSQVFKQTVLNTVVEVICSTFLSVLIGFLYAYAVVKGCIPFKRFFSLIPFIHLVTPPFVGGLSFILLLGRQGFITKTLLGLNVSLYGLPALLIAQSLCFFPIAYLICAQTLQNIDSSLENASKSLGSGRLRTFFKVTLPLSFSGIISAALFIAASVMSDFGNPMIVAGRYKVLAVEIYTQLTGWMNSGTSAVLGMILVIHSVLLFYFQNKFMSRNLSKVAVVSGNAFNSKSADKPSIVVRSFFTLFCAFIALCVIAQFAAIIAGTFQKLWGINLSFTLNHIKSVLGCLRELSNSVRFAFEAALLSTFFATFAAYFVYRSKFPFKKYIDSIIQLPAAIPGTLFGLAWSVFFARLNYKNSSALIVMAITAGFIPFSYKTISASFLQLKKTLDNSAASLGAGPLKLLFTILVPLSKEGLFNSFIYAFVRGVGTMSAVIFLISFDTPLSSVKILNLAEQGFWGDAAALSLVLTLITFIVLGAGELVIRFWGRKNGR